MYERDGIFICTDTVGHQNSLCAGILKIVELAHGLAIEWHPVDEPECHLDSENSTNDHGWAVVNTTVATFKAAGQASSGTDTVELRRSKPNRPIICELNELKSYKLSPQKNGWPQITLIQKDGTTHPTLNFHNGGLDEFLQQLDLYLNIKKSAKEKGLYLVMDPKIEALQQSFKELHLFSEHSADVVSTFFRDPYTATLGSFSKVTNFLAEAVLHSGSPNSRPEDEMIEILQNSITGLDVMSLDEQGYEVISTSELGALPQVSRGSPLSPETWTQFMDSEGRIQQVSQLSEIIFRGGVAASIRSEVWKFLLGYYAYDSTHKTRLESRKKKVDDYFRMKLQWKSLSPDQEKRFSQYRDRKNLVEKDVTRTDRAHPFFAGEGNENVQLLFDILVTYCMHNFDLGYVQGMSDLLSPILAVMENEVDAFWCFVSFMERVGHNFEMDQQGIKLQLKQLHMLLCCYDAELTSYLESRDSDNMYFCFRWLLVIFKREFNFADVMRLWEVLWTDLPCRNFHLLLCLATLVSEKHTIIENKFGFTEIVKRMNDLSQHIPLDEMLCKAEAIYLQIKECSNVSQTVKDILGLPPSSSRDRPANGHSPSSTTEQSSPSTDAALENLYETSLRQQYF